ncbi:MAG: hypothetical protein ACNYWU_08845, partial [Desulfobacterales bacterium]
MSGSIISNTHKTATRVDKLKITRILVHIFIISENRLLTGGNMSNQAKTHEFKSEVKQLLKLIIN